MVISFPIFLAGLLFLLLGTQAQNIQAVLGANITKNTTEKSLLLKTKLYIPRYNSTLHFDDVPTDNKTGSGPISTYSYLNFSSFTAIDTHTAASLGSISIRNVDCASSQPNALFSTHARYSYPIRPRWESNLAKLHAAGLSGFFNLNGLSVKPLGNIPRDLVLEIIAWEIRDSRAQNVYNTWFAYTEGGYQEMEYYNLTMFGSSWGRKVNMVEIYARAQDQEKGDWAFCLDDLDVEFLDRGLDE